MSIPPETLLFPPSAGKEQEIVNRFAQLAKPRLLELLRLKVPHVYDETPGDAISPSFAAGREVRLMLKRTVEPYGVIERLITEDKVIGFVVNPGLVPLAKAISFDVRGKGLLVTRRIAASDKDKGVVAHLEGFGVRIMMYFDSDQNETHIIWECLYGVA